MSASILEAIRQGRWDYEPDPCESQSYSATSALPGSQEKVLVMCERVRRGLPLWHPGDRRSIADADQELGDG